MWEVVARQLPAAPALLQGERVIDWHTFNAHADGVAAALLDAGLERQDKVAQFLYNAPEYLEAVFATWKAALVPVNTNYRYGEDEIVSLWENADVAAVAFHGSFADLADGARRRLPRIRLWLWVDDDTLPCPPWATPFAEAAQSGARPDATWSRSGDDLWLLYTGGTTGMPKGVMWRQDDLLRVLNGRAARPLPIDADLDAVATVVTKPGPVTLIACPLMHGTGAVRAFPALNGGGCIVTLNGRRFDPVEVLDTIMRRRVTALALVGDAFSKPLVEALDAQPDRWDISSLRTISSSGALFSETVVRGLLRHNAALSVIDVVGASEAMGIASATWTTTSTHEPGQFVPSADTRVLPDGRVARRGNIPLGYYKDAERSALTFPIIDGERWSVPGDHATMEPDGSMRLLGRGTSSINTAGEKVWPEEVEAVIKELPVVADVAIVGVPDDRLGESVTAVVVAAAGAAITEAAIINHVKQRLAGYKAPKRVLIVASLDRLESGKIDHRRWKQRATELLES